MNFNNHSRLEGCHAFLGASKYHWINYSEEKIAEAYYKALSVQRGTELHDLEARLIKLGQKLPKSHNYILFTQGEKSLDIYDDVTSDLVLSATRKFDKNNPWYSVPMLKILAPIVKCVDILDPKKVAPKHTDLAFEVVQRTASSPKEIRVLPSCVANK